MDPYFRPILIAGLIVILFNTVFIIPINGAPLITYFVGGVIAAFLFKRTFEGRQRDTRASDASIVGIGTGIFAGAVLALIFAIKLQDEETKRQIMDLINETMKMRSTEDFQRIKELNGMFLVITSIVTILLCSITSLFGSLCTLPFINKKKQ